VIPLNPFLDAVQQIRKIATMNKALSACSYTTLSVCSMLHFLVFFCTVIATIVHRQTMDWGVTGLRVYHVANSTACGCDTTSKRVQYIQYWKGGGGNRRQMREIQCMTTFTICQYIMVRIYHYVRRARNAHFTMPSLMKDDLSISARKAQGTTSM